MFIYIYAHSYIKKYIISILQLFFFGHNLPFWELLIKCCIIWNGSHNKLCPKMQDILTRPLTIPLNGNRFFHGLFQSVTGFLVMDSNFNCILHHQTKLKWTRQEVEKLTWTFKPSSWFSPRKLSNIIYSDFWVDIWLAKCCWDENY